MSGWGDAIALVLAAVVTGLFGLMTSNVKRGATAAKRGADNLGHLRREMAALARALGRHLEDHDRHGWNADNPTKQRPR